MSAQKGPLRESAPDGATGQLPTRARGPGEGRQSVEVNGYVICVHKRVFSGPSFSFRDFLLPQIYFLVRLVLDVF